MLHIDILLAVLLFDGALGYFASVRTQSALVRFSTWLMIPIVAAFIGIGPQNLMRTGGEGGRPIFAFAYLVVLGIVATGVGSLLGYFVRQFKTPKS